MRRTPGRQRRQAECAQYSCPGDCDDTACYSEHLAPLLEQAAATEADRAAHCPPYTACVLAACPAGGTFNYDTAATFVLDCNTTVPDGYMRTYPKPIGDTSQAGAQGPVGDDGGLTGQPVVVGGSTQPSTASTTTRSPFLEVTPAASAGNTQSTSEVVGVQSAGSGGGLPISLGAIIGIAVGVGVLLIAVIAGLLFYCCKQEKKEATKSVKKKQAAGVGHLSPSPLHAQPPPRMMREPSNRPFTSAPPASHPPMTYVRPVPVDPFADRPITPTRTPPVYDRQYPHLNNSVLQSLNTGQAPSWGDIRPNRGNSQSRYQTQGGSNDRDRRSSRRSRTMDPPRQQQQRAATMPPELLGPYYGTQLPQSPIRYGQQTGYSAPMPPAARGGQVETGYYSVHDRRGNRGDLY